MTRVLCDTRNLSREKWLKARRTGIGGSDIAVVCGLSPWQSPYALWLEKTGQVVKDDIDNEAMLWGRLHEDTVAREFARRTAMKVSKRYAILQHDCYPWMLANIDRYCIDEQGRRGILEVKTTCGAHREEWEGDTIPEAYLLQVSWYMGVTGAPYGYVACLIGGNRLEYRYVPRDEELINSLIERGGEFWRCVETLTPPDIDGHEATGEALDGLYPAAVGEDEIELPVEALTLIERYQTAKGVVKQSETDLAEWENRLKALLGDRAKGRIADRVVSWTNITSERIDTKKLRAELPDIYSEYTRPSVYRRFAVK